MSNFEMFIIVMVCAVPVVALLFVLPKKAKKTKKEKTKKADAKPTKTYEEVKKEEEKVETKNDVIVESKQVVSNDISTDDFKGYLNFKKKDISKPSRIELPGDFMDRTTPYIPRRRRRIEKKPQTIAEEINSLSPKLKAIVLSGVLDRKFFDN